MLRSTSPETTRRTAVLGVMCLALMMVVSAVASTNVALPDIARATGASQTELQWIVEAYALAFASLLLPAGALGDRFGRKPLLVGGITVFGGVAALAMVAGSAGQLIGLRAVMGIAAAFVMPVTLSVITTVFPPEERGKAVGTWVGVAAGGAVLGLLASGLLLSWFPWQSVFALNVGLAVLSLAGTLVFVPSTREARPPRLDPVGTALSVAGLSAFIFGIIEGPDHGWSDPVTLAALAGGLTLIGAFVLWELRRAEPMLDPRNFLRRGFGAGTVSITTQFFSVFGLLFLALPYLQLVKGLSPLEASAALLPLAFVVIPLSRAAPHLAARFGVRLTGPTGLMLMAAGLYVMSTLGGDSSYWQFVAGLVPFGVGMALAGAPATTAIVASLPREKQGIASAMNDVSREVGSALGIAVLGSVFNGAYRSEAAAAAAGLPRDAQSHVTASLAGAQAVAAHLGAAGQSLAVQAQAAFMDGFGRGVLAGTIVLLAGAAFVAWRAPGRAESRANAGVEAAPAST